MRAYRGIHVNVKLNLVTIQNKLRYVLCTIL